MNAPGNAHLVAATKGVSEIPVVSETHHPYKPVKDNSRRRNGDATLPAPATAPRRRIRYTRRCVVSTCCCIFLTLAVTLGLIILIHWLVIKPKNGNYDLVDAHLQKFNLTRNGTHGYDLETDMDLKFLFSNPNHKMGFDIKRINVHAFYVGQEIGQSADVPPFYQGHMNDTTLGSEIRSAKAVLSEDVGGNLQSEIGKNNVTLLIVMNAKVRNDHGELKALHPWRGVHLTCWVSLMAPNGTAPGNLISKSCTVRRDSIH